MKRNRLIPTIAILLMLSSAGGNIAMGAQTPAPSMKDQMKSMKEGAKAPVVTNSSPAPMGGTYFSVPVPKNVLATNLFGTDGKSITLNSYKGKYVVVAPFLTSCQEVCPMTSANMMLIANAINRAKMGDMAKVLEVSVDSERDSASRLKAYQNQFGDNSWTMAGGITANLKTFWKFFGVMATKDPYSASDLKNMPVDWQTGKKNTYDLTHTDEVAIISPDQKWVWLDLGTPKFGKGTLPAKLKAFLDGAGIANLNKPEEPTWSVEAVTAALSHLMGMRISS